ncbi:hypothetical protein PISMIDRAFT_363661 [Pisolithus microcarpus 441]|uniref:Unplaced genomic scaffold scaffold_296, whole genome shotgun sequence n=1 Tax=Pisolithus microcarpus 441 TaxID=765257 RepID=A0A0C9YTS2_9AGAM|nr:hypothetical protein BKA83DRAFT_380301 [Pisolithus microcarpus]KIK13692.1 hypothetical protein PISMIDRAFT_380301 [Pisolithus microcarpus 441]KIK14097.1 hypothetical protein PISMIDRAFT_363661 [Pisolithus microcarpus 441]
MGLSLGVLSSVVTCSLFFGRVLPSLCSQSLCDTSVSNLDSTLLPRVQMYTIKKGAGKILAVLPRAFDAALATPRVNSREERPSNSCRARLSHDQEIGTSIGQAQDWMYSEPELYCCTSTLSLMTVSVGSVWER